MTLATLLFCIQRRPKMSIKMTAFPPVIRGWVLYLHKSKAQTGQKKKMTAFPPVIRGGAVLTLNKAQTRQKKNDSIPPF